LSVAAKKEYQRVTTLLVDVISPLDLAILCVYCEAYSHWCDATKQIAKEGLTAPTLAGNSVNPLVRVAQIYATQMRDCAAKLGLSPRDRIQTKVEKDPDSTRDKWTLEDGTSLLDQ
jgi:P27 family predicted phage terminase small subunit